MRAGARRATLMRAAAGRRVNTRVETPRSITRSAATSTRFRSPVSGPVVRSIASCLTGACLTGATCLVLCGRGLSGYDFHSRAGLSSLFCSLAARAAGMAIEPATATAVATTQSALRRGARTLLRLIGSSRAFRRASARRGAGDPRCAGGCSRARPARGEAAVRSFHGCRQSRRRASL